MAISDMWLQIKLCAKSWIKLKIVTKSKRRNTVQRLNDEDLDLKSNLQSCRSINTGHKDWEKTWQYSQ